MSRDALEGQLPQVQPLDAHNRRLVENVRPPQWVNPEPAGRYNMVVVGAGTAGLVTAAGAAGLGAKVALVERQLLGGDCLNVGCVPSKALIRCARASADARGAGQYGVRVGGDVTVDFGAVMERMRRLRADISPNDSARRFRDLGVDVFIGQARFTGSDSVQVGGQDAALRQGLHRDREPRPRAADTGPRGGRLSDERDVVLPHRAAAPLRGRRRRADRLRDRAGVRPLRRRRCT